MTTAQLKNVIEEEIRTNEYDLTRYLPQGFIPKIMAKTGCTKSSVNRCIAIIRRQTTSVKFKTSKRKKPSNTKTGASAIVEKYLNNHKEYDLSKRLPSGTTFKIAEAIGMPQEKVANAISIIKHRRGLRSRQKVIAIKKPTTNCLVDMFHPLNVERQAPNLNRISSDKILHALMNDIPKGGSGLLIGTPTPFATSPNPKNNLLLTDELEIAVVLRLTCDVDPTIVVGNSISPDKADMKGHFWKNNNSTNTSDVIVDRVDRDSYTRYITKMVEQHSLTKVVLVTSGVWSCAYAARKKYDQEFNFKDPSHYLTSVYPNLHILAMVKFHNIFKVHHLHNGEERIIE